MTHTPKPICQMMGVRRRIKWKYKNTSFLPIERHINRGWNIMKRQKLDHPAQKMVTMQNTYERILKYLIGSK